MAVEFAVFLLRTKNFNVYCVHTVAELIVSAINNPKMMGGGHTVHEQQAVLSTTVVILCSEGERADPQRGVAVIM